MIYISEAERLRGCRAMTHLGVIGLEFLAEVRVIEVVIQKIKASFIAYMLVAPSYFSILTESIFLGTPDSH